MVVAHALAVAGAVIVGDQRHHALTDAHAHVEREALHLEYDADGGQRHIVIGDHQFVDDDVVQVEQERGQRRGHTHGKHGGGVFPLWQARAGREGNDRIAPEADEDDGEVEEGHAVGKTGGDARAQHLRAFGQQHEHEQRIKGDVQKPAEDDAGACLPGHADAADEVGKHVGKHRRHAAKYDDAHGVLPGVFVGPLPRAQQGKQRTHEHADAHREQRRDRQPQIQRKGADAPGLVRLALPEQAGDQRTAADARQPGQTQGDVEHGQDQRSGRHHVRVVGLADIKGVRHVVDEYDELTDHRRQDHLAQCDGHGQLRKHILLGDGRLGLGLHLSFHQSFP